MILSTENSMSSHIVKDRRFFLVVAVSLAFTVILNKLFTDIYRSCRISLTETT